MSEVPSSEAARENSNAADGRKKPTIGGFELLRKLGEGAMGSVYLARQKSMDRLVALKILPAELARDQLYLERFKREARTAGKLNHENVVVGIDAGQDKGRWFFAMEYVEGRTVGRLIEERGYLEEAEAVRMVLQVSRALVHAQQLGLVHRDIKPDNIMIPETGEAKLCDLGLAKVAGEDSSLTATGIALGTPHYISPEQAQAVADIDVRADIYSLGATLYHMVTGRTLFSGNSAAAVMLKHLSEVAPWPQQLRPGLSRGLCLVLRKMLARQRHERYLTPGELITDLEALLAGAEPPRAGSFSGLSSLAPEPGSTAGQLGAALKLDSASALPRRAAEWGAGASASLPLAPLGERKRALFVGGALAGGAVILTLIVSLARHSGTSHEHRTARQTALASAAGTSTTAASAATTRNASTTSATTRKPGPEPPETGAEKSPPGARRVITLFDGQKNVQWVKVADTGALAFEERRLVLTDTLAVYSPRMGQYREYELKLVLLLPQERWGSFQVYFPVDGKQMALTVGRGLGRGKHWRVSGLPATGSLWPTWPGRRCEIEIQVADRLRLCLQGHEIVNAERQAAQHLPPLPIWGALLKYGGAQLGLWCQGGSLAVLEASLQVGSAAQPEHFPLPKPSPEERERFRKLLRSGEADH